MYDTKDDDDSEEEDVELRRSLTSSPVKKTRSSSASRLSSKLKSALSDSEERDSFADSQALVSKSHDSSLSKLAKESRAKAKDDSTDISRKSPNDTAMLEKTYTARIAELEHDKMIAGENAASTAKEVSDLRDQLVFLRRDLAKKDEDLKAVHAKNDRLVSDLESANKQVHAKDALAEGLKKDLQAAEDRFNKDALQARRDLVQALTVLYHQSCV